MFFCHVNWCWYFLVKRSKSRGLFTIVFLLFPINWWITSAVYQFNFHLSTANCVTRRVESGCHWISWIPSLKWIGSITAMSSFLSRCLRSRLSQDRARPIVPIRPCSCCSARRPTSQLLIWCGHRTTRTWTQISWLQDLKHHAAAYVCESRINNMKELKQRLIEVWSGLQQNIVNTAVSKWRIHLRACICTQGGNFEHLL